MRAFLLVALMVTGSFVLSAEAGAPPDPHHRAGMDVPVEGTVRAVRLSDVDWPENFRPLDEGGWSTFKATGDTRILYVSASEGNDDTAVVYEPSDEAVGEDPFNPGGSVRPFKSVNIALGKQRPNMPDWILLKRGDVWNGPITEKALPSGKSADEPRLIGAYGPLTRPRPVIKKGGCAFGLGGPHAGVQHVAIVSLELYNSHLDPESPDWDVDLERLAEEGGAYVDALREKWGGWGNAGIGFGSNITRGKPLENILIEDCCLRFCSISGTNFGGPVKDFALRRNVLLDVYPLTGHTVGLWNSRGSVLLEENIADHCGWYNQSGQQPEIGWANMMSHNLYYSKVWNTVLRRNLWLRSSSIGNKFRADNLRTIGNLLLEDNLYVDGELGPAISGNYPGPYRNVNVDVVNSVLVDIGRSRPTNRYLAWYFPFQSWDGGNVANNLLIRQHHPKIRNAYGILLESRDRIEDRWDPELKKRVPKTEEELALSPRGGTRNVNVFRNIVYGIRMGEDRAGLEVYHNRVGGMENIQVYDNQFQFQTYPNRCVRVDNMEGLTFRDNKYYSAKDSGWFLVNGEPLDFDEWVEMSGEQGAEKRKVEFPDPDRSIEKYMESLGYAGDDLYREFFRQVRRQRKGNWREEFTAGAINGYFRAGFAQRPLPLDELPPVKCGPFKPEYSYRDMLAQ